MTLLLVFAQPPDEKRAGEVAEDADWERPTPACGDAERNDVCDAVLEATEDEERHAENNAEW